MKAKKLFETEHLELWGNVYKTQMSEAVIMLKTKEDTGIIICDYALWKDKPCSPYRQKNGLCGSIYGYGDKLTECICDYSRYGEFVRCLDEFNDLVIAKRNTGGK